MTDPSLTFYLVAGIAQETVKLGAKPEYFDVFRDSWAQIQGELEGKYSGLFTYQSEPAVFCGVKLHLIDDINEAKGALHV